MEATAMPHADVVSRDELRALLERPAAPCVALFMPIGRAEPARQQNALRLENLAQAHADERVVVSQEDAQWRHRRGAVRASGRLNLAATPALAAPRSGGCPGPAQTESKTCRRTAPRARGCR